MTIMMIQKGIKTFIVAQIIILATVFISVNVLLNAESAFLSAFFIILGSMFSYKKTVSQKLKNNSDIQTRDDFEKLDDPFELYDQDEITDIEQTNIKSIIKNEKKRLKANHYKNLKLSSGASFSIFRILPYIFLATVFILLSHNHILVLKAFLPSLAIGIFAGYMVARDILSD